MGGGWGWDADKYVSERDTLYICYLRGGRLVGRASCKLLRCAAYSLRVFRSNRGQVSLRFNTLKFLWCRCCDQSLHYGAGIEDGAVE